MEILEQIDGLQETLSKVQAILVMATENDNFSCVNTNVQLTIMQILHEMSETAKAELEHLHEISRQLVTADAEQK